MAIVVEDIEGPILRPIRDCIHTTIVVSNKGRGFSCADLMSRQPFINVIGMTIRRSLHEILVMNMPAVRNLGLDIDGLGQENVLAVTSGGVRVATIFLRKHSGMFALYHAERDGGERSVVGIVTYKDLICDKCRACEREE